MLSCVIYTTGPLVREESSTKFQNVSVSFSAEIGKLGASTVYGNVPVHARSQGSRLSRVSVCVACFSGPAFISSVAFHPAHPQTLVRRSGREDDAGAKGGVRQLRRRTRKDGFALQHEGTVEVPPSMRCAG